jgi:DNA-binding NtrC family response regulator
MHSRILVIVKDHAFRSVLDPLLDLNDIVVALRVEGFREAQAATVAGTIDAVILQTAAWDTIPAAHFFKWVRSLTAHQDTPLVLLTGESGLDEDEAIGAIACGARIFRSPCELTSLVRHLEDAAAHRRAA